MGWKSKVKKYNRQLSQVRLALLLTVLMVVGVFLSFDLSVAILVSAVPLAFCIPLLAFCYFRLSLRMSRISRRLEKSLSNLQMSIAERSAELDFIERRIRRRWGRVSAQTIARTNSAKTIITNAESLVNDVLEVASSSGRGKLEMMVLVLEQPLATYFDSLESLIFSNGGFDVSQLSLRGSVNYVGSLLHDINSEILIDSDHCVRELNVAI
jgi:ABC-type multidrug transport system fused ATPase/permease subunit